MAAVDRQTRDAEVQLAALLPALDPPVRGLSVEQLHAVGLGQRGRELYRDVRVLVNRSRFIAATTVERAMLDR